MKRFLLTMAVAILMGVLSRDEKLAADSPYAPMVPGSAAPMPVQSVPAPLVSSPVVVLDPAMVVPAQSPAVVLPAETVAGPYCRNDCPIKTKKICVTEEEPRTKIVYSSRSEDYCVKCCFMKFLLGGKTGDDGCPGCSSGVCGKPRTRNVLVMKKVEISPAKTCVIREVPDESCPKGKCPPVCAVEHDWHMSAPLPIATTPEIIFHPPTDK
jgi:hypothetical protein